MKKRSLFCVCVMVALVTGMLTFGGCASDAQTGGLIGSVAGAGTSLLIASDIESALIGAAVGGAAGYIYGNEQDKGTPLKLKQVPIKE